MKKVAFILFLALLGGGYYLFTPAKVAPSDTVLVYITNEQLERNLSDLHHLYTNLTIKESVDTPTFNAIMHELNGFGKIATDNLDNRIIGFLRNPNKTRAQKISTLFLVVRKHKIASAEGQYIMDYLAMLYPIELAEYFIASYKLVGIEAKIKIMKLLKDATFIYHPSFTANEKAFVSQRIEKIQQLLYDEIIAYNEPLLFARALEIYSAICPSSQVKEVLEHALKQKHINDTFYMQSLVELALSEPSLQNTLLLRLQNNIEHNSSKQVFNKTLLATLKDGVEIVEALKPLLHDYLMQQEPLISRSRESLEEYYIWAEVTSKLSKESLATHLFKEREILKIFSIILYADKQVLSAIKNDARLPALWESIKGADVKKPLKDAVKKRLD